jgi:hypothetical protein
MSITAVGAGLSPLAQSAPQTTGTAQAPLRSERAHHGHGHGHGKPSLPTEHTTSATSTSATGTTLNSVA